MRMLFVSTRNRFWLAMTFYSRIDLFSLKINFGFNFFRFFLKALPIQFL